MKRQATGNNLWALAKMQQRHLVHLLNRLTTAVHRNLPAFTGQLLANSIWGFATIGHTHDQDLLGAIAKQATTILRDAHAVCVVSDVLLSIAICQACMSLTIDLQDVNLLAIANIMWACQARSCSWTAPDKSCSTEDTQCGEPAPRVWPIFCGHMQSCRKAW